MGRSDRLWVYLTGLRKFGYSYFLILSIPERSCSICVHTVIINLNTTDKNTTTLTRMAIQIHIRTNYPKYLANRIIFSFSRTVWGSIQILILSSHGSGIRSDSDPFLAQIGDPFGFRSISHTARRSVRIPIFFSHSPGIRPYIRSFSPTVRGCIRIPDPFLQQFGDPSVYPILLSNSSEVRSDIRFLTQSTILTMEFPPIREPISGLHTSLDSKKLVSSSPWSNWQ